MTDRPTIPDPAEGPAGSAEPRSRQRRHLLLGLGALAGGAALGPLGRAAEPADGPAPTEGPANVTGAPQAPEAPPFRGPHQAGVLNPRPMAGSVASFAVLGRRPADLKRLLTGLTERIEFLTQGGPAPSLDPRFPPADSGILGTTIPANNLTVTVAVGASLFDQRFGLAAVKPRHLQQMTGFPNDALDAGMCHGDLLLQFCADNQETNLHALRDIIKHFPDLLALRWRIDGFAPQTLPGDHGAGRNLLGFKDGTANPDVADRGLIERVVWVQRDSGEPAWAVGGSYQAVRVIRHFLERWDRTPLQEQQRIFGRDRATGAPLGQSHEFDQPNYAGDPEGKMVPLDSHMRLANPRTPETQVNLLLRRPFNYSREVTKSGQLDMGLIFICFQADLEKGFIAVQNRLNGEPLEEYIKPFGGGYFFVLPGAPEGGGYLGQTMLESA